MTTKIKQLYQDGNSLNSIATELNLSYRAVWRAVKDAGIMRVSSKDKQVINQELATKGMRKCFQCGEIKPVIEFSSHYKTGPCKGCSYKNKRNYSLKVWYGVNLEQYQKMYEDQKGCCAICGEHESKSSGILL